MIDFDYESCLDKLREAAQILENSTMSGENTDFQQLIEGAIFKCENAEGGYPQRQFVAEISQLCNEMSPGECERVRQLIGEAYAEAIPTAGDLRILSDALQKTEQRLERAIKNETGYFSEVDLQNIAILQSQTQTLLESINTMELSI